MTINRLEKYMKLNLFITAVTPGIALALIIYWFDRHDREPIRMLLKVFLMGMIYVIPTVFVENLLSYYNVFAGVFGVAFTAFIIAGLTEEFMKRRVVLKYVYFNPVFDEKLDGIVYCVMSALGFATIENIMYVVFRFPDVESVGLYRGILAVPAHMLFAITMGYYLSLAKFSDSPEQFQTYLKKSLIVPATFHGIFDFILMSEIEILMILFVPFVIYLWVTNLKKLNRYYKESKTESRNFNNDYYDQKHW